MTHSWPELTLVNYSTAWTNAGLGISEFFFTGLLLICRHQHRVVYSNTGQSEWLVCTNTHLSAPALTCMYQHWPVCTSTDLCVHVPALTFMHQHSPFCTNTDLYVPALTFLHQHWPVCTKEPCLPGLTIAREVGTSDPVHVPSIRLVGGHQVELQAVTSSVTWRKM